MVVPEHIFEIASNLWEPSDEFEREEYPVTYISSVSSNESMANHSFNGAPDGAR